MDENDVIQLSKKLKDYHLMNPERKINFVKNSVCTFISRPFFGDIIVDLTTLDFLSEIEVLWILLHEEGHLIFHQNQENKSTIKSFAMAMTGFIFAAFFYWLFNLLSISLNPFYLIFLVGDIFFSYYLISYLDLHFFYQPYWNDEFQSDEYAVKGLFLLDPDQIPYQIMYTSFTSLRKCLNHRIASSIQKIFFILSKKAHPPGQIRIRKVRELYNKYKKINGKMV
jgi:hypothetical protein